MSEVLATQLKQVSRHERKKYNASSTYLTGLIKRFFEKTYGNTALNIKTEYDNHDNAWRSFAKQFNGKMKVNYLDVASFETSIHGAIEGIKKSNVSAQSKLQMIRTIRLLTDKNQFIGFFQDIKLWWKFTFDERKAIHRK